MIQRKYSYKDLDGNHWPDADKGDNLFYAIDFTKWLTNEADTLDSVAWTLPDGITSSEEFIAGNEGHVKLSTPRVGNFKIICTMMSDDNGQIQENIIPMILKVY